MLIYMPQIQVSAVTCDAISEQIVGWSVHGGCGVTGDC